MDGGCGDKGGGEGVGDAENPCNQKYKPTVSSAGTQWKNYTVVNKKSLENEKYIYF